MTITDYLRQIRENAWSSRQLGTEFERFVKRYLKVESSYASQFSDDDLNIDKKIMMS